MSTLIRTDDVREKTIQQMRTTALGFIFDMQVIFGMVIIRSMC